MIPNQLREMEARATKGPWRAERDPCHFHTLSSIYGPTHKRSLAEFGGETMDEQAANTEYVATLRNLAPGLIDLFEAVEKRDNAERNLEAVCRDPEGQDDALRIEGEMPALNERIRTALARLKEMKQ